MVTLLTRFKRWSSTLDGLRRLSSTTKPMHGLLASAARVRVLSQIPLFQTKSIGSSSERPTDACIASKRTCCSTGLSSKSSNSSKGQLSTGTLLLRSVASGCMKQRCHHRRRCYYSRGPLLSEEQVMGGYLKLDSKLINSRSHHLRFLCESVHIFYFEVSFCFFALLSHKAAFFIPSSPLTAHPYVCVIFYSSWCVVVATTTMILNARQGSLASRQRMPLHLIVTSDAVLKEQKQHT